MKNEKNERGAVTLIEATFVFPIMFLVLLFLIYTGNVYYMRAKVDGLVAQYAVKAAAACADPFLDDITKNGGSVPTTISNVEPYHSILGGSTCDAVKTELNQALKKAGSGFFSGMGLRTVNIKTFKKKLGIPSSTFTAEVTYSVQMPIRLLGQKKPTVVSMTSMSVVSVTDTPEFIQNVDMVMDFLDSSGVSEKLAAIKSKVKKFLK